jgi:hypothetical protein
LYGILSSYWLAHFLFDEKIRQNAEAARNPRPFEGHQTTLQTQTVQFPHFSRPVWREIYFLFQHKAENVLNLHWPILHKYMAPCSCVLIYWTLPLNRLDAKLDLCLIRVTVAFTVFVF